jgi:Fe(3+) dicitrate transport protein
VIGSKELRRAHPVETSEMLRRIPGVQAREDPGGGGRFDVSVRGLDAGRSRRVLVLEDGVPRSLNPYAEPDMYFAPAIERYRAIEVVKGSGNVLFGPQTLAGTLNLVTIAPPEHQNAVLDLDVGNYGYVRGLGRYGDAAGEARYVVQVLQRHGDGYRSLPFDSTDALAKIAFPTGENGTATLKLGFRRDDSASDDVGFTAAMFRADPRRASLSPLSHLVLHRYDASLTHEYRFSDAVSLKTLAYAYRTDRVWRRQDYTRTPRAGETYARVEGDVTTPNGAIYFRSTNAVLDRTYDVAGVEPRLTIRARTSGARHTFEVGGRALLETADYQQRTGTYPETYVGTLDNAETHRGIGVAAFVQDRIAFTDKLLVTPGVRVEHFSYRRTILHTFENGVPVDVYREGKGDNTGVIPGIGLVYGTRAAHVFFGFHRGYAPPRVTTAISPRGEPAQVGADESTNYEVGTRLSPVKWTHLEVAGFLSNFSNQVIANTNPGADVSLVDAGATRLHGVESAARLDVGKPLGWETDVELGVRYTYSHANFRYGPDAGHLLPYAPEHTASANVDVEHRSGFGGEIAYSFVGPQFTDDANTVAEDVTGRIGQLDPWHIVNATVHYKHAPSGLTIRLTAKNLLDTVFIAARRPEGIQPGPFRLVMLGLRWEWDAKPAD